MRRFLRSSRGRLVLFQVAILAVASALTAFVLFEYVSVSRQNEADNVLYDQWTAIANGLTLRGGVPAYAAGSLPETSPDQLVPVEAELYTRDGLLAQTTNHVMADDRIAAVAHRVLATGTGTRTAVDAGGPDGSPRRLYADEEVLAGVPVVIVVSRSTAELNAFVRSLAAVLAGGAAAVVLLGAWLAWFVVGRSFQGLRRFTADASHELRGPLTLIRTQVEVALTRPREPEDYERVLRSVRSEVEHLGRVTDQLLLLAQADAGTLVPLAEDVDVADLVEEEAARWRVVAVARGVEVVTRSPEAGTVRADPDLLRRVIDNLLDNAIRHSPDLGTVELRAQRSNGQWLIEVADQGPGVAPEQRDRLFQRFARTDPARGPRGAGAGLGLALSAAVARAHRGTLELADGAGAGATFRLRLP